VRTINKIVFYPLYWLVVAPLVITITIDLLTYPAVLLAMMIWGDHQPLPVQVAVGAAALWGLVLGLIAVFWIWRRYRAFIATVPLLTGHS
jgi:hypothetical protein